MKKKKIYKKVTNKINPLIEELELIREGDYPMEEFTVSYWEREELQKICNLVFEETYKLINATNTKNRKQKP